MLDSPDWCGSSMRKAGTRVTMKGDVMFTCSFHIRSPMCVPQNPTEEEGGHREHFTNEETRESQRFAQDHSKKGL